jgi:hypothetical protein
MRAFPLRSSFFAPVVAVLAWALGASAQDSAAGKEGDSARAEIAPKVQAARAILDGWQSKDPEKGDRKLHIVYWTPADREPAPRYRERLSKILEDIRKFYAREMERIGFGPRTLQFDHEADGLIRIHVVKGRQPYAHYATESGQEIRGISTLRAAGINASRETIVIFCNMANWDPEKRAISQNSPYYAGGTLQSGTAWQVDSPILDLDGLAEKEAFVQDGQYGRISLGRYNSIFIGGIAHELGHALTLPHNKARRDERAAFGTALMGSGNRTYGEDRRGEGLGSFLTLGEAFRLAGHPIFSGSVKGLDLRPSVEPTELKFEQKGKGFVVSGRAVAEPPVYGIVAYMDPEGGGDYDAPTITAVPDAEGRFSLDCQELKPGATGELRITFLQANGMPSGPLSSTPFRFPYSVAKDGTADIGAARTKLLLKPLIAALDAGKMEEARLAAASPAVPDEPRLREIVARLLGSGSSKRTKPSDVKATSIALSDLEPVLEKTGYGAAVRDRLPAPGNLLIAGGQIYAHGLYAHAPAQHEWELDGGWKKLTGHVGLADGNDGTVIAVIEADGKELWRSSKLKGGRPTPFDIAVESARKLTLRIEDAGDGRRGDWGVWLEPTLSR